MAQHFVRLRQPKIYDNRFEFLAVQLAKSCADVNTDFGGNGQLLHALGQLLNEGRIGAYQKHATHRSAGVGNARPRRTHSARPLPVGTRLYLLCPWQIVP